MKNNTQRYNSNALNSFVRLGDKVVVSALAIAVSTAISTSIFAQENTTTYGRNIDKRIQETLIKTQSTTAEREDEIKKIRSELPNVNVTFNDFGVVNSLSNPVGNITSTQGVRSFIDLETTARNFLNNNSTLLGLMASDVDSIALTDTVTSISGVTHYYYTQMYRDIPVYNAQLQMHVTKQGDISLINNEFVSNLASKVDSIKPKIAASQAIYEAALALNLDTALLPEVDTVNDDSRETTTFKSSTIAPDGLTSKLVFIQMSATEVALAWNFQFQTDHGWPDITVNAETGELITSFDMMKDAAYNVYAAPIESPIHTLPLPPEDARTLEIDPENATASPDGWLNDANGIMVGNNVHACADTNNNNACDTPEPVCTNDVCDFLLDLSSDPADSINAAITNLFYWNNYIHDVQYQYGFDEVGGNFQEDNFGRGGSGSDSVNADVQDAAILTGDNRGNCNANFSSPTDGRNPRMQMFLCDESDPAHDGDFDNGVITHEYGHGISTRQVGGPSNSSCLNNTQQGGEGWSDFFALVYTAEFGDQGSDARGVGSYLVNLEPDGSIRPQQYSTDPNINDYTYASLNGLSIPHGVGSVWAQALWEVYWVLVDEYGFEEDLMNFDINDPNEAGNKRALFYVNEGLKNTSCSPSHVNARDGVIAAVTNSFDGADVCRVWEAFAGFGLGVDAVSGGSNSTSPTNGFALPSACTAPAITSCPAGTQTLYAAGFEDDNDGWAAGNSTCSSGTFVRGTPTAQADGITTQVAGAAVGSNAWFTATNTSVGVDDVDGGTCETLSPVIDVSGSQTADIYVSYFHGQRDAGDDSDDGFSIDVLNNGAVANTLVSIGDVTTTASWTSTSTSLNNPGQLQLRVRASDGVATGDVVEGGVDNILICGSGESEPTPTPVPTPTPIPGLCSIEESFEAGTGGWTNSAESTCSTGAFISGTPSSQGDGGVISQVGGASDGAQAYYTASNSSAGVDDVDGGNCIAQSPSYDVAVTSELSLSYFHGQRDTGGDANGDFFSLEYSIDGGNSFTTLASNGDSTLNASWTGLSASIPAGSDVVIRTQCSDGTLSGDLIECGIDDVKICPQ